MSQLNPKKEFTVSFPIEKVKETIYNLITSEPNRYSILNESKALNQIKIHKKGFGLDLGYNAEFEFQKISENETKVSVEMTRHIGTIDTAHEMTMSREYLNEIIEKF